MYRPFRKSLLFSTVILILTFGLFSFRGDWGFYAHRLINKMAVFTLPPEMMPLFKTHLNFISDHAVDPDKRRYATRFEAVRHYIDLDRWGKVPFDTLPRTWNMAILKFSTFEWRLDQYRSEFFSGFDLWQTIASDDSIRWQIDSWQLSVESQRFLNFFYRSVLPRFYEADWRVDGDSVLEHLGLPLAIPCQGLLVKETLSEHGILPYHLVYMQRKLTALFLEGNKGKILRCAADMGHYIGDAHVPLHTTENYNGQLTNQLGIHAFWESRIPELFAEKQYDFLVGKAKYIDDPTTYYWNIVMDSHALVDSVLRIEKRLSLQVPEDQQYCFDERLAVVSRLPCEEYARTYQDAMQGMVEERMRASIQAIGNAWYTAWVDAGQPDFGYVLTEIETTANWEELPEDTSGVSNSRLHEE